MSDDSMEKQAKKVKLLSILVFILINVLVLWNIDAFGEILGCCPLLPKVIFGSGAGILLIMGLMLFADAISLSKTNRKEHENKPNESSK